MKKYFTLILLIACVVNTYATEAENEVAESDDAEEIVVTAPRRARPGRHAEDASHGGIYTPQQAVSDILGNPLTFVGRGIPDPLYDKEGNMLTDGAPRYCVWKNNKVYIVHQGCEEETGVSAAVLNIDVYSRTGGAVSFYLEANSNYNLEMLTAGTLSAPGKNWKVSLNFTRPITGEMNLQRAFEFYNDSSRVTPNSRSCSYGIFRNPPIASENPQLVCSPRSLETNTWKDRVAEFWAAPLNNRFREAHDAVKNGTR